MHSAVKESLNSHPPAPPPLPPPHTPYRIHQIHSHSHRSPTKISRINSPKQSRQGDYASFAFETKLTDAEDQSRPDRSCSWRWTGSPPSLVQAAWTIPHTT
nr:uncharacterized protein LOC118878314 [Drosophila suzukii]